MAFSFGSPKPASTPAFGTSLSGSSSTPFGNTGGSSSTGGLFGSSSPAAPSPGLFGAPKPGMFGSTNAPSSGGLFGSMSTPAPANGAMFNMQTNLQQQQQIGGHQLLSGHVHYSHLPPQYKQVIDKIHDQIMNHKRAISQVKTMAPALLRTTKSSADAAAGTILPLSEQIQTMKVRMENINSKLNECSEEATRVRNHFEQYNVHVIIHGIWPAEALASRRGVTLHSSSSTSALVPSTATSSATGKDTTVHEQIRKSLEWQAAHVDRLEKIPSPFMWQLLEDMEQRLTEMTHSLQTISIQLDQTKNIRDLGITFVLTKQSENLIRIAQDINFLQSHMGEIRSKYRNWEKLNDANVLDQQAIRDWQAQQKRDEMVRMKYLEAGTSNAQNNNGNQMPQANTTSAPSTFFGAAPTSGGLFGSTSAPSPSGGLFGSTQAPTPSGGLFGSNTAPAPAGGLFGTTPAPSGGLFGSTPAPAPSGGLFGSTPAPAPSGGLFGSTPAPAPSGGLFGATPAPAPSGGLFGSTPAPAPSGGLFGATPAPAPSVGLFGSTPAPAPSGGLFGSTPAPPSGGLFGSTPAPVATSGFGASPAVGSAFGSSVNKSKSKSRSSRRK
jgi:Nucleoporin FG repeat region